MPIEFRCSQCEKLLKTPDDSAGKHAKCPNCGSVVVVPGEPSQAPRAPTPLEYSHPAISSPAYSSPASPGAANPFADVGGSAPFKPASNASQSSNPYASSATYTPEAAYLSYGSLAGLRPSVIGFERVLASTWNVFIQNLGPCLLLGLMLVGVYIAQQVLAYAIGLTAGAMRQQEAILAANIANNLINFLIQTFVQLAVAAFSIELARDGRASADAFSKAGAVYGRGLAVSFLIALLAGGILFVCMIPGIIAALLQSPEGMMVAFVIGVPIGVVGLLVVTLHYYLSLYFLVDRRLGIIEAMSASGKFMHGNKLTVFGLMFVVGILGGIFVLVTCFIGAVAFYPFIAILASVIYLSATGQTIADRQIAKPYMA